MSFFTDVRDTFTAPFRAAGNFVGDVMSGQNIAQSVRTVGDSALASYLGPTSLAYNLDPIKSGLKSLSPFSLGLSNDWLNLTSGAHELNAGRTLGAQTRLDYERSALKVGAVSATGGIAAASAAPGAAGVLQTAAYAGATAKLTQGDIGGAFSGFGGFGGIAPDGFKDFFDEGKKLWDAIPKPGPGAPAAPAAEAPSVWQSSPTPSSSGGYPSAKSASAAPAVIALAALAVGTYLILKRGSKR